MAAAPVTAELREFLKKVARLPERADDLSQEVIGQTFVNTNQFEGLQKDSHQIIFGRRGTGKTHVLRALQYRLEDEYEKSGIIPVYLSCKDFELGYAAKDHPVERLVTVFLRRFVAAAVNRVSEFVQRENNLNLWSRLGAPTEAKQRIDRMNELQSRIKRDMTVGDLELFSEGGKQQLDEKISDITRSEFAFKLEASVAQLLDLSGKAGLDYASGHQRQLEEFSSLVYRSLGLFNAGDLTTNLKELLDLTRAHAIYILLDEWMFLDLSIQPFFAEFLRAFVTSSQTMFLKIGCVPFLTSLSQPKGRQYIGLQRGADIFVDVDLDEIFNVDLNTQGVANVMVPMVYKHLAKLEPLEPQVAYDDFVTQVRGAVFADDDALGELVIASSGTPRDFMVLTTRLIQRWLQSVDGAGEDNKITTADVRSSALSLFEDDKKESQYTTAVNGEILDILDTIVSKCHENGDRAFLLTSSVSRQEVVMKLFHERFINLLHRGLRLTIDGKSQSVDLYTVDFGAFASALLFDLQGNMRSRVNVSTGRGGGLSMVLNLANVALSALHAHFRKLEFILDKDSGVDLDRIVREPEKYLFDSLVQPTSG